VRVYGSDGALLGVGEAGSDGVIAPKRVIAQAQASLRHAEVSQKIEENP
jgi:hypothetical protein